MVKLCLREKELVFLGKTPFFLQVEVVLGEILG
jgi:hypothetical protein